MNYERTPEALAAHEAYLKRRESQPKHDNLNLCLLYDVLFPRPSLTLSPLELLVLTGLEDEKK